MAFSTGSGKGPMADINVTPLVDVMLVLLIIFMITAPILTHRVQIDLPQRNQNNNPDNIPKEPVKLKIDQSGALYWNDSPVDELTMKAQMAVIAQEKELNDQPEIQIQANPEVQYEVVARVMADAKSYNLVKVGFAEVQ